VLANYQFVGRFSHPRGYFSICAGLLGVPAGKKRQPRLNDSANEENIRTGIARLGRVLKKFAE
jgi:hypothetical protein